jgi:hypothetical protein
MLWCYIPTRDAGVAQSLCSRVLHASLCQSSLFSARYRNSIMRVTNSQGARKYPVGRMQGVRLSGDCRDLD